VNYAVKSSLLLSFLESAPGVSGKLKEPNIPDKIRGRGQVGAGRGGAGFGVLSQGCFNKPADFKVAADAPVSRERCETQSRIHFPRDRKFCRETGA